MKKVLLVLLLFVVFCFPAEARKVKSDINNIINSSGIDKNLISVSVKSVDSGKIIYSHNDKILMHPASVQKILTLPAIMEELGDDYKFTTGIYSRGEDGYLIKLGADPYFSSGDLKGLVRSINGKQVKQIYIDDSIIESKSWGEGWQWDDDLNLSMLKFNSYNIDRNIIKFTIMPSTSGENALIANPSKYPVVFLNNVVTSDKNSISVSRDNSISSNTLMLSGTVQSPVIVQVPLNNLKRYFDVKLTQIMGDRNIYVKNSFLISKQNESDKLLDEIKHPISQAVSDVLLKSDNMVIETMNKLAGGKASGESGTDVNGLKLFESYCKKLGIDNSRVRLVDASGVSKNNLTDSDFVTEFLVKSKDNNTLKHMAKAGEGTLANRMIPLHDNLRAKTGTLSDISSLAGYLTTKSGQKCAFCIIINDPKSTSSDKKALEDYIIRELYIKG